MESLTKARSRLWNAPGKSLAELPLGSLVIGSFFFVGLSPFASGTVGSAVAVLLYLLIPFLQSTAILLGTSFVFFIAGTLASNRITRKSTDHDPGIVVVDEVVGQWLALLTLWYPEDPVFVVSAFVFFRLFDILKIFPASLFEKRHGGLSVMLDDVIAGIYACIAANLATYGYYEFLA